MRDIASFQAAQTRFAIRCIIMIASSLHRNGTLPTEVTLEIRSLLADLKEFAPDWNDRNVIDRLDRLLI